ncbi:amino acid ABC transporter permease [Mycolicibacterium sp. HK-90]|uniref:amino acid ABC transporter permease n=1 Tax=Mycolicibacterium sp. HK-90 TaxID=3056937 RepID=UPI0026587805|nr:amino acid ABC transporter permease [Mycolicibacterium sp. HK-90]WKG03961.1 amino acid ABC transporter permease [Mycolicibacterium sp. HK-90]
MTTNPVTGRQPDTVEGAHLGEASVVRLKHPGRWVAVAVIAVLLAMVANAMIYNPNFGWATVGRYFLSAPILAGLQVTITLTVIGMIIGFVLGTVLALMRMSANPILRTTAFGYVWLLRGIPLLVQLIFWYNISALFPTLSLGIPFGPEFVTVESNTVMTAYTAAILGLGLNQAAYMAEIIRGGLQSVDEGQLEAAATIGLSRRHTITKIVLPQAMRVILPPTGNETITMLKTTSLVSVVAVADLLYSTQLIYARNFQTIPLLIMASIWYLILVSVLNVGQFYLERHYGRGSSRQLPREQSWNRWRRRRAAATTSAASTMGSAQEGTT